MRLLTSFSIRPPSNRSTWRLRSLWILLAAAAVTGGSRAGLARTAEPSLTHARGGPGATAVTANRDTRHGENTVDTRVDPCPFYVDAAQSLTSIDMYRGVLPPRETMRVKFGNVQEGAPSFCIEQDFDPASAVIAVSGATMATPPVIRELVSSSGRPHWEAVFDVDFIGAGTVTVSGSIQAYTTQGFETLTSTHQIVVNGTAAHDASVRVGTNPATAAGGASAQFEFFVRNTGRMAATIDVSCRMEAGGTCSSVLPNVLSLAPKAEQRVLAYVQTPSEGTAMVTVSARAHTTAGTWYDPVDAQTLSVPIPPIASVSLDYMGRGRVSRAACPIVGAGPGSAVQCGDLLYAHTLPGYRTRSKPRTFTLLYNSATADPRPVVTVDHKTVAGQEATRFKVDVWRVTDAGNQLLESRHFDAAGADGATLRVRRFVVPVDAVQKGLSTGAYPVRVQVTRYHSGGADPSPVVDGDLLIVDRRSSPWGAGWWPAGIERLYPGQAGGNALLVQGDGSTVLFRNVNGTFTAPAGEHSTLRTVTSASGGITGYTRDLPGGKVQVSFDPSGNQVKLSQHEVASIEARYGWTAGGPDQFQLTSIADPTGLVTWIDHETGSGRAWRIRVPAVNAVTLEHQGPAGQPLQLTGILDPDQHRTGFAYEPGTLRMTQSDARATDAFTYAYDAVGRVSSTTPPAGGTTRHYSSWQRAGAPTATATGTSETALAPAALADTVSFATWMRFDRGTGQNAESRATFRLHFTGAPSLSHVSGGDATQFVRDSAGQPTFVRTMGGAWIEQAWDANGNLYRSIQRVQGTWKEPELVRYDTTLYEYHPHWRTVTKIIPPRTAETTTITYGTHGNRESVTDGRGKVTTFTYTADGLPETITAPATLPVTYAYHPNTRNVTTVTQGTRVTTYSYDPTTLVDLVGTSSGASSTSVEYDAMKRVKRQESGAEILRYVYDDMNRTVTQYDARNRATTWSSDAQGKVYQECRVSGCLRTTYSGDVPMATSRDGGYPTTIVYDAQGRVERRYNRDDDVTYGYDVVGRQIGIANRHATIYRRFDAYSRLTCELELVRWRSDSIRMSGVGAWHDYDRMGRRVRTFLGKASSCNVRQSPIPDQEIVDPLNPTTWAEMPPSGHPGGSEAPLADSIRYTFDTGGNLETLSHVPYGYRYTGSNTWTWRYDDASRVTRLTSPRASMQTTEFGYSGYGDLDTYTVASSYLWTATVSSRDPAGKPQGKSTSSTGDLWYEYDLADRLKLERRNSVDELIRYDDAGNITRRGNDSSSYGDGVVGGAWNDGRLLQTDRLAAGTTTRYAYDRVGNQTAVGSSTAVDHGYVSQAGDRLNTYNASNQLIESRVAAPNNNGNCTGTWREERRVIRYDGLGRRIVEESYNRCADDYGITRYFWVDDHVIAKVINFWPEKADSSDRIFADLYWPVVGRTGQWYVYGPGTDNVLGVWNGIEGVHWKGIQNTTRYLLVQDDRGSVIASVCLESGPGCSPPANGGFTAFGSPMNATAGAGALPGFNGQQATGGLVYMRNRWYDPNTGRFTQEDPIGFAGGSNLYAYAGNDPVNYSDPYGLCPTPGNPCPRGFFTGLGAGTGAVGGVAIAATCTAGSGGLCALGAPAIVAGSISLGTTVGAAADAVAQNSAAITTTLESVAGGLRRLILAAGLFASTHKDVDTSPTNPCGDGPPPEQTTTQKSTGVPEDSGKKVISLERNGCK